MAYQWGPVWWPGLFDFWHNSPTIKILVLIFCYLMFRYYASSRPRFFYSKKRVDGKTAIVTGASRGIGLETAKELARRGCRVILACRDMEKGKAAKEDILAETKNAQVVVQQLDLASNKSIREFCRVINETESRLDFLIHNAGVLNVFNKLESADDKEHTMAVNFFGPFLLTHLLIDLLKKTEVARIVCVVSRFYNWGHIDLKYINCVGKTPWRVFCDSKLAMMCFSQELARRLKTTGITVNCVHPGTCNSDMYRSVPWLLDRLTGFRWVRDTYWKTPLEAAQGVLYTTLSDELEDKSGNYIVYNRCEKIDPKVLDVEFNQQLWDGTRRIVNFRPIEPKIV